MKYIQGISTLVLIALLAGLIVFGGVILFNLKPMEEKMKIEGEALIVEGTDMISEGEAIMEKGVDMLDQVEDMKK